MARAKGMLNLSGNLEVNAQAPLDARTIVPTEADLTVANNFPYPYIGLEVYVTGTGKKFRLINLDTTQSSSWHEVGEGGGSGGGGHTIQDDGVDMTARDNLNFVGMEVDDNSADGSTDVAEHRLTSAEISEMMGGIPNPTPRYPILFDERGTEYQVGWYILSNGTKKPVYQKTVDCGALPNNNTKNIAHGISNLDKVYAINGVAINSSGNSVTLPNAIKSTGECVALQADRTNVIIITGADWSLRNGYVTMLYTKTTDTPV